MPLGGVGDALATLLLRAPQPFFLGNVAALLCEVTRGGLLTCQCLGLAC